ncbi:MAG: TetR/AcrR family transcriptional regulator [Gammaproteobacteria bacterium HGW-Gammaproteobacteria-3]|nr:MAG: TetR/AcrR family transcriptional regulator [Gammaproteobacteria bacterium HGW-Gammaproteobacteria-3]
MDQETDNNKKKLDSQDEILLAALKLFAEKGYFNTSLSDIAEAVGLKTTSSIYQHFKNKQTIASALYADILDSLSISIDDIRRRNKKPSEQLREIVGLLFRLTQTAPNVMTFLLVMNRHEFLPEEKPLLETAPFVKILKIIQTGIRFEEIRGTDPLQAYMYFFGIINQTLRMALAGSLAKNVEAYQSQVWMTAWNAICKK